MTKFNLICNKCNADMEFISQSGSSRNHNCKEIWDCPVCNFEVLIQYIEEK
jgi:hypothetical protein